MPILTTIISSILSSLSILSKHLIVFKLSFLAIFISILDYIIAFFIATLDFTLISSSYFYSIASYLGLISAIGIFLKMMISIFFAKQLLSYFRN